MARTHGRAGDPAYLRAYRVAAIRAAEEVVLARVPEGSLMQRAAAGLAAACARVLRERRGRVTGARVVLLVGAGNNGGDALWAGARLAGRGARVDALLLAPSVHAEGLAALRSGGGRALAVPRDDDVAVGAGSALLAAADLVVDGIVGLGGSPGLREPAAGLVAGLDAGPPPGLDGSPRRPAVVAVDLPSGVDADGGTTPAPHVRADLTVTFGAAKPGLLAGPAARAAGEVQVVDLGLGPHLPATADVERLTVAGAARLWPVPGAADDKYARGVVGVVAGSALYTGAAVLATGGALRSGAGMVRYVGPQQPTERVRARWPEAVTGPGRVQAWAVGSGVDPDAGQDGVADDGQPGAVRAALESAAADRLPAVVDAGALVLLARPGWRQLAGPHLLLTPHAGELARLLGAWSGARVSRPDVEARPLEHARAAAAATGAVVLLKGAITLVAHPDGRCRTQADAPPWLATAGAGDVLTGIAGTLLAAGLEPLDAGSLAALVHGRAAAWASGGGPIVADDIVTALPAVVTDLLTGGERLAVPPVRH
jgi:ADP-dependent NAD(P)H-hydrate dehydratase / NAD(P)H-hydrate epimerase